MLKLPRWLSAFAQSKAGVTSIEYGLLAALVAVAIVSAVALLGANLAGVFGTVADKVSPH